MQKVLIYDQTIIKNEVFELKDSDVNTDILGLILGSGEDVFDLKVDTLHLVPRTTCQTDFRIILKDKATCTLKGLIKIAKEAHQTDAFLTIKSFLLSEEAEVVTEPSLEIEANDVKASHSASSGPPDPEQIFYLKSRGLTDEQAEGLIVEGFMGELTNKIENDNLRKRVQNRLEVFLKT